jgi:hypothetical protein
MTIYCRTQRFKKFVQIHILLYITSGRALVKAVSRLLHTVAARVRTQVSSCGICGAQSDTGAGFLRVLPFPLLIRIPPIALHPSAFIRGWYSRPGSGRRTERTQSHPTPTKKTYITSLLFKALQNTWWRLKAHKCQAASVSENWARLYEVVWQSMLDEFERNWKEVAAT